MRAALIGAAAAFIGISALYTKVIAPGGERAIAWRDHTAQLGAVRFPQQTISIIRTRKKLAAIIGIVSPKDAPVPAPPPIDFRQRVALLYSVGPRSSTGYDVRVLRVTDNGERVLVTFRELTPSLRDRVEARLTFPYRLITIPATDKPIRFALQGRP